MVLIYFTFCSSFLWFGLVFSESLRTLVVWLFTQTGIWRLTGPESMENLRILFFSNWLLVAMAYYVPCTAGRITGKWTMCLNIGASQIAPTVASWIITTNLVWATRLLFFQDFPNYGISSELIFSNIIKNPKSHSYANFSMLLLASLYYPKLMVNFHLFCYLPICHFYSFFNFVCQIWYFTLFFMP